MLVERIARLQFGQKNVKFGQKLFAIWKNCCEIWKKMFSVNPPWKTGIRLMQVKRIAGMFERRQRIGIASKQNNIFSSSSSDGFGENMTVNEHGKQMKSFGGMTAGCNYLETEQQSLRMHSMYKYTLNMFYAGKQPRLKICPNNLHEH